MALKKKETPSRYFDRDISWLSFNERVLMEAERENVPLQERLKFLAIYASNLDEFYRVRMASIVAWNHLRKSDHKLLAPINKIIGGHLSRYGHVLRHSITPRLAAQGIVFLYNAAIPQTLQRAIASLFFTQVAGLLQVVRLRRNTTFFPGNNQLFFAISLKDGSDIYLVNIPSDQLSRFHTVRESGITYVLLLDDIIRQHLSVLLGAPPKHVYSFKITRDAELNLKDDIGAPLTAQLEKLLAARDLGWATRLLYDAAMPGTMLTNIVKTFKLARASQVAGGRYHNLKDLFAFPRPGSQLSYGPQFPIHREIDVDERLFDAIDSGDILLHPPYHSYELILRFFNEAAIDPAVERIYVTLYRIATDSAIARTLITAARNGKKVSVLVELKARFDEANNLRWAAKMKEAGVSIAYSGARMKVHAKIALVKRVVNGAAKNYGLLATGNFNENTAKLYTDHVLLTSHKSMLKEVQSLFRILMKEVKAQGVRSGLFKEIIVAPFNIRERFFALIDREIDHVKNGRPGAITIKLNNLEEESLIDKLYEASSAGVPIQLIVRGICRLIPGKVGLSENIQVRRIIDRYLEHGRIYAFHNNGEEEVYCGSADWMNRNIYHRIEVCFPIHDSRLRTELLRLLEWQLLDTTQAVIIDEDMNNRPVMSPEKKEIRSQEAIYKMISEENSRHSR